MGKYSDRLRSDLVREHSATLAHAKRPHADRTGAGRAGILRRPHVLAGGSLGVAGVAAGLVIALGAGGAAAPPAFAVTRQADGTVLVHLGTVKDQSLPQVRAQLLAMGINETVGIDMGTGPATVSGPVDCAMHTGASIPVKVLLGADGTETIGSGQAAENTGEGAYHLISCSVAGDDVAGNTGDAPPPVG